MEVQTQGALVYPRESYKGVLRGKDRSLLHVLRILHKVAMLYQFVWCGDVDCLYAF